MSEQTHIQLRKRLDVSLPAPVWPEGIALAPFYSVDPRKIHALLDETFPGLVARFEDWYGNLKSVAEFDPALSVTALTTDGSVAGYAQCWKHGFVKDLAVAPSHQGKGLGEALIRHVFALLAARGIAQVDLEVEPAEEPARRLYARLGMVEV